MLLLIGLTGKDCKADVVLVLSASLLRSTEHFSSAVKLYLYLEKLFSTEEKEEEEGGKNTHNRL
jgi:hypothetical protein